MASTKNKSTFKMLFWEDQMYKIAAYLRFGEYPFERMGKEKKRDFRRIAGGYKLVNGNLHKEVILKRGTVNYGEKVFARVITIKKDQRAIIQSVHSGSGESLQANGLGGHQGINKTLSKISPRFYWERMGDDVKKYIRACDNCQRVTRTFLEKGNDELHPIPVPNRIWSQVGIDIMCIKEVDGYKYVITAIDYMSKYVELRAIKEKTATETAKFIFEELVCRYGCPDVHITDQGREFVNAVNEKLLFYTGTKHRVTAAYHPQANGLVERMNRTTSELLLKTIEKHDDWPYMLHTIAFAHRTSVHASTNHEPIKFLIGRRPRLPIEMKYLNDEDLERDLTEEEATNIENEMCLDNAEVLRQIRTDIIGDASYNIKKAQARQKKNYDLRNCSRFEFKLGDLVLKEIMKNKCRAGGKMDTKFTGPYIIEELFPNGTCRVSTEKGTKLIRAVPCKQLKRYIRSEDEEEEESIPEKKQKRMPTPATGTPLQPNIPVTPKPDPRPRNILVTPKAEPRSSPQRNSSNTDSYENAYQRFVSTNSSTKPTPPAKYKFHPLTNETRKNLMGLFNIPLNENGPLYCNIGQVCKRFATEIHKCDGDGNCFFRAISYILSGTENYHDEVRQTICDFIETNDCELEPFLVAGEGKGYVITKNMRCSQKGTMGWGTDVEMMAVAKISGLDVYTLYMKETHRYGFTEDPTAEGFYIQNKAGQHYDVVLKV